MEQIKAEYPYLHVFLYYSFGNLIYHPDNLEEYYAIANKSFNKDLYIQQLAKIKNDERDYIAAGIIQARNGIHFIGKMKMPKS